MDFQTINIGTAPNDGLGDNLRTAGPKINSNFSSVPLRFLNVEHYRQSGDPADDYAAALQLALNAASPLRAGVYVPAALPIKTQVVFPDYVWLEGGGWGSIITGDVLDYFISTSREFICLSNLKLATTIGYAPRFIDCPDVMLGRVNVNGNVGGTQIAGFGVQFEGCGNILVDKCKFVDLNDAIYLNKNGSTNCGSALVRGSWFEHTIHGTRSYPAALYQYFCDDLWVEGCHAKNILPGVLSGEGSAWGVFVYDGDGTVNKTTTIVNCTAEITEADQAFGDGFIFAYLDTAQTARVAGNVMALTNGTPSYKGSLIHGNATKRTVVSDNVCDGFSSVVCDGIDCDELYFERNKFKRSSSLALSQRAVVRIGANGFGAKRAFVDDNVINGNKSGVGIYVHKCTEKFAIRRNTVLNCNQNRVVFGGSNFNEISGILIGATAVRGDLTANTIENTLTSAGALDGYMIFGIVNESASADSSINADQNNNIIGMLGAPTVGCFGPAALPTRADWVKGQVVWYWQGTLATDNPGTRCVESKSAETTATVAIAATTWTVPSTGIVSGDLVKIAMDNGNWHYTTCTGAPTGATITVTTGPTVAATFASIGKMVHTSRMVELPVA